MNRFRDTINDGDFVLKCEYVLDENPNTFITIDTKNDDDDHDSDEDDGDEDDYTDIQQITKRQRIQIIDKSLLGKAFDYIEKAYHGTLDLQQKNVRYHVTDLGVLSVTPDVVLQGMTTRTIVEPAELGTLI